MQRISPGCVSLRLYDALPRDILLTAAEIYREASHILAGPSSVSAYLRPLVENGLMKPYKSENPKNVTRWLKTTVPA
jgi:hypothetical protein